MIILKVGTAEQSASAQDPQNIPLGDQGVRLFGKLQELAEQGRIMWQNCFLMRQHAEAHLLAAKY